jgi:sialate O-acetylesterase
MPSALLRRLLISLVFLFGSLLALRAEVTCPPIFSDHMVLQRDLPAPVWGRATPGEQVTVEFAGQRHTATATPAGDWRIILRPLRTSREPRPLTIRGTNTLTFTDVLVGEVWFCSGQSNMEKPFGPRKGQKPVDHSETEVAAANHPQLRLFQMPHSGKSKAGDATQQWLVCSPEALTQSGFSAAAYYFGRELLTTLDVPIGLIHSSFGGTRIEAWMPSTAFSPSPELRDLPQQKYQAWVPGVQATELYASMVAPFVPFALRGFLWYQGEANCMEADIALYPAKQRALIAAWRAAFQRADAPFYFALLAPFDYSRWEKFPKKLTPEALPAFWEAQARTLDVPNTGLIVTTDLAGNVHDIHPTNKKDVGLRFARLALKETYGKKKIPAHGPRFAKFQPLTGARLRVTFTDAAGLRSRDGQPLTDFQIAGLDGVFYPATATVEKNAVIVSSPQVPAPAAVRFAWHETATPNLVNAASLPAVPFRTDTQPIRLERPPTDKK